MGVGAADLLFLKSGEDSSFQNLSEFLGAILAVIGQIALGHRGRSVALRGDSVTALTWAITERPRGERLTKAAMVFSLLCIAAGVDVKEVTHITGTENKNCDRLSRRGRAPTMSILVEAEAMGLRGVKVIAIDGDEDITDILKLCDPRCELHSEEEHNRLLPAAKPTFGSGEPLTSRVEAGDNALKGFPHQNVEKRHQSKPSLHTNVLLKILAHIFALPRVASVRNPSTL